MNDSYKILQASSDFDNEQQLSLSNQTQRAFISSLAGDLPKTTIKLTKFAKFTKLKGSNFKSDKEMEILVEGIQQNVTGKKWPESVHTLFGKSRSDPDFKHLYKCVMNRFYESIEQFHGWMLKGEPEYQPAVVFVSQEQRQRLITKLIDDAQHVDGRNVFSSEECKTIIHAMEKHDFDPFFTLKERADKDTHLWDEVREGYYASLETEEEKKKAEKQLKAKMDSYEKWLIKRIANEANATGLMSAPGSAAQLTGKQKSGTKKGKQSKSKSKQKLPVAIQEKETISGSDYLDIVELAIPTVVVFKGGSINRAHSSEEDSGIASGSDSPEPDMLSHTPTDSGALEDNSALDLHVDANNTAVPGDASGVLDSSHADASIEINAAVATQTAASPKELNYTAGSTGSDFLEHDQSAESPVTYNGSSISDSTSSELEQGCSELLEQVSSSDAPEQQTNCVDCSIIAVNSAQLTDEGKTACAVSGSELLVPEETYIVNIAAEWTDCDLHFRNDNVCDYFRGTVSNELSHDPAIAQYMPHEYAVMEALAAARFNLLRVNMGSLLRKLDLDDEMESDIVVFMRHIVKRMRECHAVAVASFKHIDTANTNWVDGEPLIVSTFDALEYCSDFANEDALTSHMSIVSCLVDANFVLCDVPIEALCFELREELSTRDETLPPLGETLRFLITRFREHFASSPPLAVDTLAAAASSVYFAAGTNANCECGSPLCECAGLCSCEVDESLQLEHRAVGEDGSDRGFEASEEERGLEVCSDDALDVDSERGSESGLETGFENSFDLGFVEETESEGEEGDEQCCDDECPGGESEESDGDHDDKCHVKQAKLRSPPPKQHIATPSTADTAMGIDDSPAVIEALKTAKENSDANCEDAFSPDTSVGVFNLYIANAVVAVDTPSKVKHSDKKKVKRVPKLHDETRPQHNLETPLLSLIGNGADQIIADWKGELETYTTKLGTGDYRCRQEYIAEKGTFEQICTKIENALVYLTQHYHTVDIPYLIKLKDALYLVHAAILREGTDKLTRASSLIQRLSVAVNLTKHDIIDAYYNPVYNLLREFAKCVARNNRNGVKQDLNHRPHHHQSPSDENDSWVANTTGEVVEESPTNRGKPIKSATGRLIKGRDISRDEKVLLRAEKRTRLDQTGAQDKATNDAK